MRSLNKIQLSQERTMLTKKGTYSSSEILSIETIESCRSYYRLRNTDNRIIHFKLT